MGTANYGLLLAMSGSMPFSSVDNFVDLDVYTIVLSCWGGEQVDADYVISALFVQTITTLSNE